MNSEISLHFFNVIPTILQKIDDKVTLYVGLI